MVSINSYNELAQLNSSDLNKVQSIHLHLGSPDQVAEALPRIYACKQLKSLSLIDLPIKALSPALCDLVHLKKLHLNGCPIQSLPEQFHQLQALEDFSVYDSDLTTLPDGLFELKQLQKLSLAHSKIQALDPRLVQLKQLKVLTFFYTPIQTLPDYLQELTKLEELSLYGLPIKTIPSWIGQLKQLKLLGTPEVSFDSIPYFLFELKKLAYYSIPKFKVKGVAEKHIAILRQYLKQHASVATAQAYVHLFLPEQADCPLPAPKFFVPLSYIKNKEILATVLQQLKTWMPKSLSEQPLEKGSEVAFLGDFEGLEMGYIEEQLTAKGIQLSSSVKKSCTHIVLSANNKRKFDPKKYSHIVLLSNEEMRAWLRQHEGADYLTQANEDQALWIENIQQLLFASNLQSIHTALELLKSGGIPKELILPLLIAYSDLINSIPEERATRASIRKALYRSNLSEAAKQHIRYGMSKGGFSFHPKWDQEERRFQKRLERKGHPDFDMIGMANYYFQTERRAYLYLLDSDQVAQADKIAFIKANFLKGTSLNLSKLPQLKQLPAIFLHFDQITSINLQNCAIVRFPKLLDVRNFPALRQIDLRQNPIQKLPKNISTLLPNCKCLLE